MDGFWESVGERILCMVARVKTVSLKTNAKLEKVEEQVKLKRGKEIQFVGSYGKSEARPI